MEFLSRGEGLVHTTGPAVVDDPVFVHLLDCKSGVEDTRHITKPSFHLVQRVWLGAPARILFRCAVVPDDVVGLGVPAVLNPGEQSSPPPFGLRLEFLLSDSGWFEMFREHPVR